MTKETVVFKALVAHHRVEIRHRHFNGRNEFALSITGGRWQYHSFFSPSLKSKAELMKLEISKDHPRAKWHISIACSHPLFL